MIFVAQASSVSRPAVSCTAVTAATEASPPRDPITRCGSSSSNQELHLRLRLPQLQLLPPPHLAVPQPPPLSSINWRWLPAYRRGRHSSREEQGAAAIAVEYLAAIQRRFIGETTHIEKKARTSRRPRGPTLTTTKLRLLIHIRLS